MKFKNLLFISFLLLGVSCSKEESRTMTELPPIPVVVEELSDYNTTHFISATGRIEAKNSAQISTRMMGFINSIPVKIGQKVKKGELLANIHNADLTAQTARASAAVAQAAAAFDNAKKDRERYEILYSKNSATQKEWDDIQTHFNMAKAQLETAKQAKNEVDAQFSYTRLTAPFSGVISGVFLKEGDMANPGMPVLTMENTNQLEAVVQVSERDILQIKQGMKASILVKSLNKEVKGRVSEISKSSKNTGGQFLVKVELNANQPEILSGMIVNVNFEKENQESTSDNNRIFIPQKALVKRGQLTGVYIMEDNQTVLLRWLKTGKKLEDQIEVLSGLSVGEKYVVEAEQRLFNGSKVTLR